MFWVTDVCDVPMYLFRSLCQDIVIPIALDKRLPLDTLFMVFEEDYRFFPDGEDIDGCDDYSVRLERMLEQRKDAASHVQTSLPPLDTGLTEGQSSGKGFGKVKPESRFHATMSRGSSDLTDEVNEGFSSNLADLVRWATVAHRHKMGHLIWLDGVQAKNHRC